uniref:Uncharacterized protein n=1 Tax=Anguilla anguilla TaxID=7936 RepID=A0A0E9PJP3_ANGAN
MYFSRTILKLFRLLSLSRLFGIPQPMFPTEILSLNGIT